MVRLLGALGDHCPRLLHPFLDGAPAAGRRHFDAVLPAGHLGVVALGGLEPLQALGEGGAGLDGGFGRGQGAGLVVQETAVGRVVVVAAVVEGGL